MNKKMNKIISLIMAVFMLFSCISCEKEAEEEYEEERRLEIIKEPLTYSEEFIEQAANSFADIAESLVFLLKNVKVTSEQKRDLRNYFKIEIFPIIVRVNIYSSEVDDLFSATRECLSEIEAEGGSFLIFANLYKAAIESIDATRAGLLAFEFSKMMISEKAEENRARYEKYGYKWYLDDALRYEALEKNLNETLGKDKFITAGAVAFFVLSSVYGIGMPENELGLSVNEKETVAILKMQAEFFTDAGITDEDWKIFAELLCELVPENNASHINAELYALKKDNYFVSASEIMTPLLSMYEAVTKKLSKTDEPLKLTDGSINLKAVLRAALSSEDELSALLDKTEGSLKTSSKAESEAVSSLKLNEAYEQFINGRTAISSEELISELHRLLSSEEMLEADTLYGLLADYIVGIAPYLAFAAIG